MKLLAFAFMLTALTFTATAQAPYVSTSSGVTLTVTAWSTSIVPTAASEWRPVTVTGTWITACATNSIALRGVVITHKDGPQVVRSVEDFGYINDGGGTGVRCGNILSQLKRESIVTVSVVTGLADFSMN